MANVSVELWPGPGQAWNAALAALPLAHVLQTWEWGQFKARHGWAARYLLWRDQAGTARAAALVLRRRLAGLPLHVLYVPKGPALDYACPDVRDVVLADLEALARRERAVFVKIDPDVELGGASWPPGQHAWLESREQIQFRNTMVVDLASDEGAWLAAMHPKTRYNIRLAERKGVSVRQGGQADLDLLYAMYRETARRDGFVIRPAAYYHDAWGSFVEAGLGQPLLAEVDGQPVAGLILFRFGKTAYYFYGMSRDVHRDKMPNYALQWAAMRWARQQGCVRYDLWGAPQALDEGDPMYGVYRFKQGFGARLVQHVGAWDYPALPWLYWLYAAARPHVIAWMHRLHNGQ